ncbi:MAG: winged helix DNA-binding domain-containing protein [Acidimicrobiales bacterium]
MATELITERELNRALLARQGLVDRMSGSLGEVVTAVGALQMQYWPALGPGLWTRVAGLGPGDHHRAHETGELVTGTLLRGTIHTVPATDYPAYAVTTLGSKLRGWRRTRDVPGPEIVDLERGVLDYTAEPRRPDDLAAFIDDWAVHHPGVLSQAELDYQRTYSWRPWRSTVWLLRVPADGTWGPKTPTLLQSRSPTDAPTTGEALDTVARRHLGAFGPAAVEDVAWWIHWNLTPVRRALEQMEDAGELVSFVDDAGRVLYDLPDAPRPGGDVEAPVRLLPWFDSTLLAYAPKRRTRILPDAHKDVVLVKANGQLKPTFLVDGKVAGIWSLTTARGTAAITLTPLEPVARSARKALLAEAEGLARFCHPDAEAPEVRFADV